MGLKKYMISRYGVEIIEKIAEKGLQENPLSDLNDIENLCDIHDAYEDNVIEIIKQLEKDGKNIFLLLHKDFGYCDMEFLKASITIIALEYICVKWTKERSVK